VKLFLFRTVASITGFLIGINLAVGNLVGSLVAYFCNGLSLVIRFIGERLMMWIDADRYRHASVAAKQSAELTELSLLMAANQIKEDAVESKVWTARHTNALNVIANELHNSCGWEPVRIHKYLRPLVESIPGMGYSSTEDPGDCVTS
jgi:hypothetical protein